MTEQQRLTWLMTMPACAEVIFVTHPPSPLSCMYTHFDCSVNVMVGFPLPTFIFSIYCFRYFDCSVNVMVGFPLPTFIFSIYCFR